MGINRHLKLKLLVAGSLLAVSVAANAGLIEGDRYLAAGQYDRAYTELKPLADHGDPTAQFYVGTMYIDGTGVKQDVSSGVKLLTQAAKQGDTGAQLRLARIYYDGKVQPQDLKEAVAYARKAATAGLGEGSMLLGVLYYKGAGVPQSTTTALALMRDASEKLAVAVKSGQAAPAALADSEKAVGALTGRVSAEQNSEARQVLSIWRSKQVLPGDEAISGK